MAVAERSIEQDLRAAVRTHERRSVAAKASEVERDEAIRRALAAGVTHARAAQLTGLSPARIDQIRRGARL